LSPTPCIVDSPEQLQYLSVVYEIN